MKKQIRLSLVVAEGLEIVTGFRHGTAMAEI